MAKFVNIDRDTPMLLPPNMRDWVPSSHIVHFMIDAIESLDTSMAQINHRGTGVGNILHQCFWRDDSGRREWAMAWDF